MHVGQSALEAVVIKRQALVNETWRVQDRGVKIVHRDHIFDRSEVELVRCPVAKRIFDTRPRQPAGKALRVVIAPEGALLQHRHVAELGAEDHPRVFEQTALLEIFEESSNGTIQDLRVNDAYTQTLWACGAVIGSFSGGWLASHLGRRLSDSLISRGSLSINLYIFLLLEPTDTQFLAAAFAEDRNCRLGGQCPTRF